MGIIMDYPLRKFDAKILILRLELEHPLLLPLPLLLQLLTLLFFPFQLPLFFTFPVKFCSDKILVDKSLKSLPSSIFFLLLSSNSILFLLFFHFPLHLLLTFQLILLFFLLFQPVHSKINEYTIQDKSFSAE